MVDQMIEHAPGRYVLPFCVWQLSAPAGASATNVVQAQAQLPWSQLAVKQHKG